MAAGLKVMASSYPVWLLTRDVTARTPGLTPELLVAASAGCPHDYTLTPRDMLRLSSSSTLIINGRGFEAFLFFRSRSAEEALRYRCRRQYPGSSRG